MAKRAKKGKGGYNIAQIDLMSGILKTLDRLGVKEAEPRIINACISAANEILKVVNVAAVNATPNMGLENWLASDDTGMSSQFMARELCGARVHLEHDEKPYPLDPADFGRCVRFLAAVPFARAKIGELAKHGPVWAEYVKRWEEMEALYAEELPSGRATRLYAMMDEIRKANMNGGK